MPELKTRSPLVHDIGDWLLDRSLHEGDLTETIRGLGRKLVAGGMPVCRINAGGVLLHPVLGALDITWDADSDTCQSRTVPRSAARTHEFKNAPFYPMVANNIAYRRYRLQQSGSPEFPLLQKLAESGVTDYVALFESYGRKRVLDWAGLPTGAEGAVASFSTKRPGGFTDQEVADLRSLTLPYALAVKMATEHTLATSLLETYLGEVSGRSVLAGLVERGDGRVIECTLWYSDLRGSTAMATSMDIDTYFGTINDYFECTAGAVLENGGEVLKLIGDAVMAIFPFANDHRSAAEMCKAAAVTALEALARREELNSSRSKQGLAPLTFGVGLHAGKVMYGNVGIERRLDMTVTGPAANEVERLESLCKGLAVPVVASGQFKSIYRGDLEPLGRHEASGIDGGIEAYTLPELANSVR